MKVPNFVSKLSNQGAYTRSLMKSGYLGVSSAALKPAMTQMKVKSPSM